MDCRKCGKCGATYFLNEDGKYHLRWATGKVGRSEDLAGLVCNKYGDDQCINPLKGNETGDTWERRLGDLKRFEDQSDR